MRLVLFRHGIAEAVSASGRDFDRALTRPGVERAAAAARGLATLIDRPGVILTSPKTRARQTAELAGSVFGLAPVVCDLIAEGDDQDLAAVAAARPEPVVMLVGHEPAMSRLIGRLVVGGGPPGGVVLKKAGAALIEAPAHAGAFAGPGRLHWLVPPRVLRRLVGVGG